jgi:hypothetical protein
VIAEATIVRTRYEGGDEPGIAPEPVFVLAPADAFEAGDDVYVEEIDERLTVTHLTAEGFAVARASEEW